MDKIVKNKRGLGLVIQMTILMSINTPLFADVITPDHRDININIVKNNVQVIDTHKNWNVLLYKEALKIKELKPLLNNGLKASKELDLF